MSNHITIYAEHVTFGPPYKTQETRILSNHITIYAENVAFGPPYKPAAVEATAYSNGSDVERSPAPPTPPGDRLRLPDVDDAEWASAHQNNPHALADICYKAAQVVDVNGTGMKASLGDEDGFVPCDQMAYALRMFGVWLDRGQMECGGLVVPMVPVAEALA